MPNLKETKREGKKEEGKINTLLQERAVRGVEGGRKKGREGKGKGEEKSISIGTSAKKALAHKKNAFSPNGAHI